MRTSRDYRDRWEQLERENLQRDVDKKISMMDVDKEYKELYDNLDNLHIEKEVEDALAPKEGEEALDEDTKALETRKLKFKNLTRLFFDDVEHKKRQA